MAGQSKTHKGAKQTGSAQTGAKQAKDAQIQSRQAVQADTTQAELADIKVFCSDTLAQTLCTNTECAKRVRPTRLPVTFVVPSETDYFSHTGGNPEPEQTSMSL